MSNATETLTNPETITNRTIRAKKIASGVIQGKSYTEIAKDVSPNAKLPRQTVYNSIQSNFVQTEIAKQMKECEEITPEWIAAKIKFITEHSKNDSNRLKGLELLAKWKAMLTEKREISQKTEDVRAVDTSKMTTEELVARVLSELRVDHEGVKTTA